MCLIPLKSMPSLIFSCSCVTRYEGTDTAIMTPIDLVPLKADGTVVDIAAADITKCTESFAACYSREYGFELQNRSILVDDLRVRCVGHNTSSATVTVHDETGSETKSILPNPEPHFVSMVYFEDGRLSTPVYLLKQFISAGSRGTPSRGFYSIPGPAIIVQDVATVIVEPGCTADVSCTGNIEITVHSSGMRTISSAVMDPIYLSIFSHRFMGIAEQMGRWARPD